MKTIILDITNEIDNELLNTQKVFNNMVRYGYNRLIDNKQLKEKDLRKLINETFKQPSWKEMFNEVKKSKLKYRFLLLDYIQNAVFSKIYIKQKVTLYTF